MSERKKYVFARPFEWNALISPLSTFICAKSQLMRMELKTASSALATRQLDLRFFMSFKRPGETILSIGDQALAISDIPTVV